MVEVEVLPMDVHVDESVNLCVDTVVKKAGRLDLLVNNAGYALRGAIEETSLEEAKAEFETNFWGVVRTVKAVLPIMRRHGSGQIINLNSMVGVVAIPFSGFYSASKFALEGYSAALRHEVKPFDIRISLVEPFQVKTHFIQNQRMVAGLIDDYAPWRESTMRELLRQHAEEAAEPRLVAETVLHIANERNPKLRYQVGKNAGRLYWLNRHLLESLIERSTRRRLHMDNLDQSERQEGGTIQHA